MNEWWHEWGCSVIIGVILWGLIMWFIWRYIDVIMFIVICGLISPFWLAFKVIDKINGLIQNFEELKKPLRDLLSDFLNGKLDEKWLL